jgi:predicted DNA-binding transcriptional regulator AlpA
MRKPPAGAAVSPDLRDLLDDVPPEQIPELIAGLAARMAGEWCNIVRSSSNTLDRSTGSTDSLLTRKQAAARLGVAESWLGRRRGRLPFEVSLGHRSPRYSSEGIDRWIRSRNTR